MMSLFTGAGRHCIISVLKMKDVDCENTNEIKNFSIQIVRKQ